MEDLILKNWLRFLLFDLFPYLFIDISFTVCLNKLAWGKKFLWNERMQNQRIQFCLNFIPHFSIFLDSLQSFIPHYPKLFYCTKYALNVYPQVLHNYFRTYYKLKWVRALYVPPPPSFPPFPKPNRIKEFQTNQKKWLFLYLPNKIKYS